MKDRNTSNTQTSDTSCHLPILRTCCEVSQNSAIKYSSENNSPFLFAMVLPPESNLTLISVFLPSVIHADNLPVLVSVTKTNWNPTHIHPSHIVMKKNKKTNKTNKNTHSTCSCHCSEELQFSHSKILHVPVRFCFPYSLFRHPLNHVFLFPGAHLNCRLQLRRRTVLWFLLSSAHDWETAIAVTAFKIKAGLAKKEVSNTCNEWYVSFRPVFFNSAPRVF